MKYAFMSAHQGDHRVEKMAEVLEIARSGYYAWKGHLESLREGEEKEIVGQMREIQEQVHNRYGSPRVREALRGGGGKVGHNRVARLMRENDLGVPPKRRFRVTTSWREGDKVAENLLARCFDLAAANRVWVSDIT